MWGTKKRCPSSGDFIRKLLGGQSSAGRNLLTSAILMQHRSQGGHKYATKRFSCQRSVENVPIWVIRKCINARIGALAESSGVSPPDKSLKPVDAIWGTVLLAAEPARADGKSFSECGDEAPGPRRRFSGCSGRRITAVKGTTVRRVRRMRADEPLLTV